MSLFLTFAYGANMSARALRAKGVAPIWSRRASLADAELALRVPIAPPFVGNVADVRRRPGASLPGVVHALPAEVMSTIDAWEGAGWLYDVEELEVQTAEGPLRARTYLARPEFIVEDGPCTARYHQMLLDGAREFALPAAHLQRLLALPIVDTSAPPPGCLGSALRAPERPEGEWFEVAGAVFALPEDAFLWRYLRRFPPAEGPHHLTRFFLRYDAEGAAPGPGASWSGLSDRERAFLSPFLWRMEQHFTFLGWTRAALDARDALRTRSTS